MIRIEVSVSGWQKEAFEKSLRREILRLVADTAATTSVNLEVNRVQITTPRSR